MSFLINRKKRPAYDALRIDDFVFFKFLDLQTDAHKKLEFSQNSLKLNSQISITRSIYNTHTLFITSSRHTSSRPSKIEIQNVVNS